MNGYRLVADLSHLLAIIILLLTILKTKSCEGISGRSQVLYALVFTTRYVDLVFNFVSVYNSAMKVIFIVATYFTVYLIYAKFKNTYDRDHDIFRIEFLLIPATVLAFVVNHEFTPFEVLWTFSIYLEAVAILPQLYLIAKTGKTATITSYYLFCLGSYRCLYILNWIYRYYDEGFYDIIAVVSGVIQTVLYIVFFHLYITKSLPFQQAQVVFWKSVAKFTEILKKQAAMSNFQPEKEPLDKELKSEDAVINDSKKSLPV